VGLIEAKHLEYGALDGPDAHAVVGLVLGAFGELSTSCYSYFTSIARVAAARLLSFWKMSPEQALVFSKQKIFRFWGLTGQRGWARLILDRLHDLVLSPGDSKGSTRDPDTVAHEHHSPSFQTTDTVLPMLPASAGATAAKVLVCFCIMLFVNPPPLGARKKNSSRGHFKHKRRVRRVVMVTKKTERVLISIPVPQVRDFIQPKPTVGYRVDSFQTRAALTNRYSRVSQN
jgi:hypothetical protein